MNVIMQECWLYLQQIFWVACIIATSRFIVKHIKD